MPTHPDAIGYLNDLAKDIGEPWFRMICELAAIGGTSSLDQGCRETLLALFTKRASYLPLQPERITIVPPTVTLSADFLHTLSGFSNFKLLEPTLQLNFSKRITLVFGTNGSGKSSVCESLKALASAEMPSRPLHNVRIPSTGTPGFGYTFRNNGSPESWTPSVGYGLRSGTIKYFDAGIAIKNVKSMVEPSRIVVLTPYKLHVFEWAQIMTTEFRSSLRQIQETNGTKLTGVLENVRRAFTKFSGRRLATLDDKTLCGLPDEIKIGEAFNQQEFLKEKQTAATQLEKASSEEGLRLLKAEHRELESFLASVETVLNCADSLWNLRPAAKKSELTASEAAQELLAKSLIPKNGTMDSLLALLRAASSLCKMESAEDEVCPLCRRELEFPEVELFRKYYGLLTNKLEEEIATLRAELNKARELVKTVRGVDRDSWDKCCTVPADLVEQAKTHSSIVLEGCVLDSEPENVSKEALAVLRTLVTENAKMLEQKARAIELATRGRDELLEELAKIRAEIEPLEYAQAVALDIGQLRDVQRMATQAEFWRTTLSYFPSLLKKITDASKMAHCELVVSDFEARLNAEYLALTEKPMTAFGVTLENRGSDAAVTVLPQIGGKEVNEVMSEGEQRVHALALFFAELETCSQSVIVFDDPISSFDYNYIANYSGRLRDFARSHSDRQIIVLTHNWEFFVQLQLTLNKGGLNGDLSVQVLENCATVANYSEKCDELKGDITRILGQASEPTRFEKEELAAKLRRLIEVTVNTHVFNNQRHQFKQKTLPVSEFHQFTKVTPLLSTEATELGDLYAKLSITEHDDPRNAYVNTDKATFQRRYDAILAIETAVSARK